MSDLFQTLSLAASGMKAQSARLRHVSENIANVDTPGYRRKAVDFKSEVNAQTNMTEVRTGPVRLDRSALQQVFDPSHPMADANGQYDGSNVNLVIEIADAREAQRSYDANLRVFEQTRSMTSALFDLLRR